MKARNMTEGRPLGLIMQFALPLLLGNLFQQTYNMVDAMIVGQTLGAKALAAVGSSSSVQFLVLGFCTGTCAGFGVPVAQRFGANDLSGMRKVVFNGTILTILIAIAVTGASAALCTWILNILQVQADIFENAYAYLIIIFWGIPFTLLYNYTSSILRAIGDSKSPFLFLALSAVLNIFLDYFCIVNLHMGVSGAAFATVFSQALSGVLCLIYIARKVDVLHIEKNERRFEGPLAWSIFSMGVPMGLQFSITAIGSMVMQSANNSLGTVYVSGFTAGMKIKQFLLCPFDALGTAVSTFASQNYGAGKMDRIYKGLWIGTVTAIVYAVCAGVIMNVWGRDLSMLFLSAENTAELDAAALYVGRLGLMWWMLGLLNIYRMFIQGLGYTMRAVVGGAIEMVARTVVSFGFVPKFGYDAITWADQCAWSTAVVYLIPMCFITLKEIAHKLKQDEITSRFAK